MTFRIHTLLLQGYRSRKTPDEVVRAIAANMAVNLADTEHGRDHERMVSEIAERVLKEKDGK